MSKVEELRKHIISLIGCTYYGTEQRVDDLIQAVIDEERHCPRCNVPMDTVRTCPGCGIQIIDETSAELLEKILEVKE
jgi:hypothetical protein